MVAVALPALVAAQAAVAGVESGASGDADRMCQHLRATGATDNAKATLLLQTKLPRAPADEAGTGVLDAGICDGVTAEREGLCPSERYEWCD
jgi:hypothetical protein